MRAARHTGFGPASENIGEVGNLSFGPRCENVGDVTDALEASAEARRRRRRCYDVVCVSAISVLARAPREHLGYVRTVSDVSVYR